LGECCKLPQWGLGQSAGRPRISSQFQLKRWSLLRLKVGVQYCTLVPPPKITPMAASLLRRPSLIVDNAFRRSYTEGKFSKSGVWGKVPEGSTLIFCSYLNFLKTQSKEAYMPKTSSIHSSVSIEMRLLTDTHRIVTVWSNLECSVIDFSNIKGFQTSLLSRDLRKHTYSVSAATLRRHCFSHRTLHYSVRLCDRL